MEGCGVGGVGAGWVGVVKGGRLALQLSGSAAEIRFRAASSSAGLPTRALGTDTGSVSRPFQDWLRRTWDMEPEIPERMGRTAI